MCSSLAKSWTRLVACCLGHPDRARARAASALDQARKVGDVDWVIDHITKRGEFLSFLSEPSEFAKLIEEVMNLASTNNSGIFTPRATILKGYVQACHGDRAGGRALIRQGLAKRADSGNRSRTSHHLALLAATHVMDGEMDQALRILNDAVALTEETGERWYAAELHRQIGDDAAPARRERGGATLL